ncbi:DNA sulfur modification protein DndC [Spiroplasma gladiatoris]|uniref:DNA sulfur modification protein DndC n=1 Tax=Spiroplasma gladiatoris TaxID=2143 RepID=A0A4P7AHW5_9MOLU|nr:DNA phosphorothioation system sulfurtransferase DndC [Spiroplasma gladiatoris]QBQ07812.1 DNA sulfur modification protein DndC [Spiroplasma gladiatoris]
MENVKEKYLNKVYEAKNNIKKIYLEKDYTWMIGYSGGKDSNVLVQIIIEALLELKTKEFNKKIHIVSSDTLIENPIVLEQLNKSLKLLKNFSIKYNLPIEVHKVSPDLDESFWVNLIGRGYPLPNQSFRWCTDRLKIKPMNKYVEEIEKNGSNILTVLGVRKGESKSRDIKLDNTKIEESLLRENTTNKGKIFSPIEDFTLFDIWKYLGESSLVDFKANNLKLSLLYEDSSTGVEECPSSLDDKLQKGCGSSRWGCWLCPVVTKDKSLQGFINSGNNWLKPLIDFREELIKERDLFKNRYHASFRINKTSKKVTLIKYRFMDLKEKDGVYFLPKKDIREKIIFGQINNENYLINEDKKIKIFSESEARQMIDDKKINPYHENNELLIKDIIVKLDKNLNNNKLSIMGLGPYTLSYRINLLERITDLNKKMKKYDMSLISEQEIIKILDIIELVKKELEKNDYLIKKYTDIKKIMEMNKDARE